MSKYYIQNNYNTRYQEQQHQQRTTQTYSSKAPPSSINGSSTPTWWRKRTTGAQNGHARHVMFNGYIPTLDDSSSVANSGRISPEQVICEDLRAFENRMSDIVNQYRPKSILYRWLLLVVMLITFGSAIGWLLDPATLEMTFVESLLSHKLFTLSCIFLFGLFLAGIHKRVISHNIIVARMREVISQFNMNCDDNGRLILMPQPNYHHNHFNGF